ncbi:hypothetical protein K7X08_027958 [Anisodus acutangulus]|uniref:Uncharacterized protein n=1 Tax=Anisodus acutangulus TaxID=402998 RepID=A0A9Q1RQX4_9SOLA|nr:hypothetical protein K7X08_027958 [Anisodus acutangulus]
MELKNSIFFLLLLLVPHFHGGITTAVAARNQDSSESWGYVEVRPRSIRSWNWWEGLKTFLNMERKPIYCGGDQGTKAFTKSYKNLHFYWILGAGHFVPVDQPCVALDMVAIITQSPAVSK